MLLPKLVLISNILQISTSSNPIEQSNTNAYIPSIPHILKGVVNCDVRILLDGLQEFESTTSTPYQWPTTIIFVPNYYQHFIKDWIPPRNASFALNILQIRMHHFCVVNLLFVGNQTVLQSPTHDSENYFILGPSVTLSFYFTIAVSFYLKFGNEWIPRHKRSCIQFFTQNQTTYYNIPLSCWRVETILLNILPLFFHQNDKIFPSFASLHETRLPT